MQDFLMTVAVTVNTYLSNYILVFLLVGVGLWYSIRTRMRWPTSRNRTTRRSSR